MARTLWLGAVAVALAVSGWVPLARETERLASVDDAFVDGDPASGRWTVGTGRIELALTVTRAGDVRLEGLRWPGGPNMSRLNDADGLATADGRSGPLGSGASGFRATTVEAATGDGFVEALVHFQQERGALSAARHYRVRPNSAAVELWTEFTANGSDGGTVQDLNAFLVTVPEGTVHWVTGLGGGGEPFSRQTRDLVPGESLTIGSQVVSANDNVPWFAVAAGEGTFFATLGWSGTWSGFLERRDEGLAVRMWLPGMSAHVEAATPVEGPHAWIGLVPGDAAQASAATQQALAAGHAPFPSLTTFNTWFVYGNRIDDGSMRDAIDQSSRLGVELFQLDAGWYPQRAPESNLGFHRRPWQLAGGFETGSRRAWAPLATTRVPTGCDSPCGWSPSASRWRQSVVREAPRNGSSPPTEGNTFRARTLPRRTRRSRLGDAAAREWLLSRLTTFIDEARPDYLKWDFNRWMICDRPEHGHTADGGGYAHIRGLYAVLDALRQRFPSLLIENCSGGGHRLDAGLLRLTDTGWMDDTTAPAAHVRHNIEGLTSVFPRRPTCSRMSCRARPSR